MGLFRSLFGKKEPAPAPMRETLFGDLPLDRWPDGNADAFPWSAFASARADVAAGRVAPAIGRWREVIGRAGLESRVYLQAWHFLREHGRPAPLEVAKQVLGVVVEVGMAEGTDLLAAYADHTARYYNFSGAGAVWERPNDSLDAAIDRLLAAGTAVAAVTGPWDGPRPPVPPAGQVRMWFLTPGGPHFGQGPMDQLQQDELAGSVIQAAMPLLRALTSLGR